MFVLPQAGSLNSSCADSRHAKPTDSRISGFFYGLIFSVLLTLAPAVLVGAVGTFRLLHHLTAR
jgi:heme/copper-type cytochrome/quinol oxidase subunit 4